MCMDLPIVTKRAKKREKQKDNEKKQRKKSQKKRETEKKLEKKVGKKMATKKKVEKKVEKKLETCFEDTLGFLGQDIDQHRSTVITKSRVRHASTNTQTQAKPALGTNTHCL